MNRNYVCAGKYKDNLQAQKGNFNRAVRRGLQNNRGVQGGCSRIQ